MDEKLIYILAGLAGLSLILFLINSIRLSILSKKYKRLIKGLSEKNVEDLMISYSHELFNIKETINKDIQPRVYNLEDKMQSCIKNVSVVSYNAFANVGNNMSFSIAALNDKKDGFVFTGIYTRENSYVYTKSVVNGVSNKELSKEEKEALDNSLNQIK